MTPRARKIVVLDWNTMAYRDKELTPDCLAAFSEQFEVFGATEPERAVRNIGDADVVICNKVPITGEVLASCPNVRYIGVLATGYNNIDLEACNRRGIVVCNAGSYSTDAVAQLVFAYILDYCEKVSLYRDEVRLGGWERSKTFSYFPYPTMELSGLTLSIIGYGAIGRRVAQIGACFGMKPLISTRTEPKDCPYELVSKEEAFARADFLTLHCPLNDETRGLVRRETLALMKETAVLINTSRGATVDEEALADALCHDMLAAAYVDVLETEPMSPRTPLKRAKNCVITPHIGWTPPQTRGRLLEITRRNLSGWLSGEPLHVVNAPVLRKESADGS